METKRAQQIHRKKTRITFRQLFRLEKERTTTTTKAAAASVASIHRLELIHSLISQNTVVFAGSRYFVAHFNSVTVFVDAIVVLVVVCAVFCLFIVDSLSI